MEEDDAPKEHWVRQLPNGEPYDRTLNRIFGSGHLPDDLPDGPGDVHEQYYYWSNPEPRYARANGTARRFRGQYLRRLRRRANRRRNEP